ncbi:hypothetical protein IJF93_01360 [Candidatus Saccharibacteria bacterium]|nr:hypothetical protein [Candidatus Saccharibacteria bacterium]
MDYFEKIEVNPYEDLVWNIPERKQGVVNVVGGNSQSFRATVKVAEFLSEKFPVEVINTVMPDALKGKLPELPNFLFLKSTESGSFADGDELQKILARGDYNIIIGDLSKNTTTGRAVGGAYENSEQPLLITRDAVDLASENGAEKWLMNGKIVIMGSVVQLQKLLKAVYYPKMLMMSQSLVQVADVLHKFTLSYPIAVITLHGGQILVAKDGKVVAMPVEKSGYSPIMFWGGESAAKIAAFNLYNPNNFIKATICALFS